MASSTVQSEQDKMDNSEAQSSKRSKLHESEGDSCSSHSIPPTHNIKKKHGRKEQEGFQPYDYSKVDFNRFQGGSTISLPNQRNERKPKVKVSLNIGKYEIIHVNNRQYSAVVQLLIEEHAVPQCQVGCVHGKENA
jgi:hypothetical protein